MLRLTAMCILAGAAAAEFPHMEGLPFCFPWHTKEITRVLDRMQSSSEERRSVPIIVAGTAETGLYQFVSLFINRFPHRFVLNMQRHVMNGAIDDMTKSAIGNFMTVAKEPHLFHVEQLDSIDSANIMQLNLVNKMWDTTFPGIVDARGATTTFGRAISISTVDFDKLPELHERFKALVREGESQANALRKALEEHWDRLYAQYKAANPNDSQRVLTPEALVARIGQVLVLEAPAEDPEGKAWKERRDNNVRCSPNTRTFPRMEPSAADRGKAKSSLLDQDGAVPFLAGGLLFIAAAALTAKLCCSNTPEKQRRPVAAASHSVDERVQPAKRGRQAVQEDTDDQSEEAVTSEEEQPTPRAPVRRTRSASTTQKIVPANKQKAAQLSEQSMQVTSPNNGDQVSARRRAAARK